MLRKLSIVLSIVILSLYNLVAQDWVKKMQDPTVNFYDVQKSFNKYWAKAERKEKIKNFFTLKRETEEENEGLTMYKRWEDYVAPRVFPTGDRSLIETGNEEIKKLITNHSAKSLMQAGGNWTALGASVIPTRGGGSGRLNCVRFNPSNNNTIYVGAAAGGLWKSTSNGTGWTTNTDALPTLGVSDIAIDPVNSNTLYLGTGDDDGGDTYSVGVLKSTDGGINWNITGLNFAINQGRKISRVLVNPTNPNIVMAGASNGVYRSTDGGITWTRVASSIDVKDMEYKPGDASVVYVASDTKFYKSIDSGNTFTVVNINFNTISTVNRLAIAVTPANPAYVYLVYSDAATSGFYALYRSTDSGNTFSFESNYPNLSGYNWDGTDSGGQAWYTLSIAASPLNADEVVVGGVNIWQSLDGGVSWNIIGHWTGANGTPYVHADIHDLCYRPDGTALFAACDGGVFETNDGGNSWQDKSAGLQIGEMYGLGCAATNPNLVIQGWQDNGTNLYDAGSWDRPMGGDGMKCFIDWSNSNYMYGELYYGKINGSVNAGLSFNDIKNNISETGNWVTPWCQDPVNPMTIYGGYKNVWKSRDRGANWTQISSINSGGLSCLAIAKSDTNHIYAASGSIIYRTTNGGSTWTNLTIPGNTTAITYIAISSINPSKIWATCSGYTSNYKVFQSSDGGTTWTNVSLNLPNIPVNCAIYQTGTADGVYVGTDLGVYYKDNTMTSWIPYSNGLPNVIVKELDIQYSSNKLRAATYGRGLWETTIYNPSSTSPFANFAGDTLSGCPGLTVHFSDSTKHNPTSWHWRFPGGNPLTSTAQNPVVTYATPGLYHNVTLIVTNSFGTDSITKYSYIGVSQAVRPIVTVIGNDTACANSYVQLQSSQAQTYNWLPTGGTNFTVNVHTTGTFSVTTTDNFNCATTSDSVRVYVLPNPPTPTITIHGDTLISSSSSGNQWYINGNLLAGATNQTYIVSSIGNTYKVTVTDSNRCSTTSSNFVGIDEITNIGISYSVFPNPAHSVTTVVLQTNTPDDISINLIDVLGRTISSRKYSLASERLETTIDLMNYPKGIYLLVIKNSKGEASKKLVVY